MTSTEKPVRVRFAPSPTGALHIGGARTALFNYLFARQQKGVMILRIEDTDQNRQIPGAEQYILDTLKWLGIAIDEGIGTTHGNHKPYRQSERKDIYLSYAKTLIDNGSAYYAFDTEEELEEQRQASPSFLYGADTRMKMKNSLTLPAEETARKVAEGAYAIRFKTPKNQIIAFNDLIRGDIQVQSAQLDDKVLMKSDHLPTYHLANVVDDYLMQISHVIRGEEWLPSTPLHTLLYGSFGWEKEMPQFAHLPLLLKPDGKGKLSKRDADKNGFPIFPLTWRDPKTEEISLGFRERGYLPEGLINFLALLGWNSGTEQEIFSIEELISSFSFDRIQKAGAKFDIKKAVWFNEHYLRGKSTDELIHLLSSQLEENNIKNTPQEKLQKIVDSIIERVSFPIDLFEQSKIFFIAPKQYDWHVIPVKNIGEILDVINIFLERSKALENFNAVAIRCLIEDIARETNAPLGKVMQGLRVSLAGKLAGPDLMIVMEIIGKEETHKRIQIAIEQPPISK